MNDRSPTDDSDGSNCALSGCEEPEWTRREFLSRTIRRSGAASAGLVLGAGGQPLHVASGPPARSPTIRKRVQLGRTGIEVPDISFGTFSLTTDEELVHLALDRGITHFDTAEGYTAGRAESALGRALRGRRHDVTLTSKYRAMPEHTVQHQMDVLERSLRRLGTDYIDIYLNHAVNDIARLQSEQWQAFIERAKREGKIRAAGISGHSGRLVECLDHALDQKLVDIVLVAYNFAQQPSFREKLTQHLKDFAASLDIVTTHPKLPETLTRAHAEGVGVMVMKTLKGARKNDMRFFEAQGRTFAQSALRFVLSDPAVDGLVISMKSPEMIDEYVEASGSGAPDLEDLALLARYESLVAGSYCQIGCDLCAEACPASVPIADTMRIRMYDRDYAIPEVAVREYASLTVDATACSACDGAPCARACPNGLAIASLNRDTHLRLT
ncbi:MAG: hypothetical protein GY910_07265 [bacterium]|nr:hypothetical protein [Deltaproteobacteria bacterium]MCP4904763.1 hypothetical protein [bacterium]